MDTATSFLLFGLGTFIYILFYNVNRFLANAGFIALFSIVAYTNYTDETVLAIAILGLFLSFAKLIFDPFAKKKKGLTSQ